MLGVALAEEAGFGFAVISDHYFPWLEAQGIPRMREVSRKPPQ